MDARMRHKLLWNAARPIAITLSALLFGFKGEVCREEGPYLVLSNHNADLDPLFVACSFPELLYFVASEHIMRQGRISDFLRWSTDIIPRQKGGSASSTVRSIIRHLKDGHSVCLFPEGNRSWDGVTRPITPATGKMARMSGAKLVTYRTEGLYFFNPRWSGGSLRRGKSRGRIVGIYEPEYLKSITATAVQELIERDLYENAYERQRNEHIPFRGRHLAEHLETLLFMCPHCKSEGKMRSEGNYFICDACGTKLRYTEEGFFTGENLIFDSVLDWRIWQRDRIENKCLSAGDGLIFSDDDIDLYKISTATHEEFLARGKLKLFADRLELPNGENLLISELSGMALRGPQDLFFSRGQESFVIKCKKVCCTSKYLSACKIFDTSLQYGI